MLHQALLKRFGGQGGLRDQGLLESALARPRSGYYTTISEQVAALMQSLALNRSFVDGNKRVAFAMTAIFLRMNGWRFIVTADEGEAFLITKVIQGKAEVKEMATWIEGKMKVLKTS